VSYILSKLTDAQTHNVLQRLYAHSDAIRQLIDSSVKEILQEVDSEDVAEDVFAALDSLDMETLSGRSGRNAHGYTSPDEAAYEMFEEELEPFIEQITRYHELKMYTEECLYCMGVLKGMYRFEQETVSEYKDWAADVAEECFGVVLNDWRKSCGDPSLIAKMMEYLRTACPDWTKET
jgi:hypothetical protein